MPGDLALLSQYRAIDGRNDEAVSMLSRAVAAGWLPDGTFQASDIAQEPSYATLLNRADFQAVRQTGNVAVELEPMCDSPVDSGDDTSTARDAAFVRYRNVLEVAYLVATGRQYVRAGIGRNDRAVADGCRNGNAVRTWLQAREGVGAVR